MARNLLNLTAYRIFAPVLFLCATCLAACQKDSWHSDSGMVWNTFYQIQYYAPSPLSDSITAVLADVGTSLSAFDPESEVGRWNRSSSGLPVGHHFKSVYAGSREVYAISAHRFDPTIGPLIKVWGFGPGHTPTADTAKIDSLKILTGFDKTCLRGDSVIKKHPGIQFNFSAIAKGYGCDMVGEMLLRNGASDFLINIGGEIVTYGRSPKGKAWKIGIDKPEFTSSGINNTEAVVDLDHNECLASSGDYRNFHSQDGDRRFGHTIDPLTGRPAKSDVLAATVIDRSCMRADALATACMAMGFERASAMADSLGLAIMLVSADSCVWLSNAMRKYNISISSGTNSAL